MAIKKLNSSPTTYRYHLNMSSEFQHTNPAVNTFVNCLLSRDTIPNRAQLILMSGVALNDVELINRAIEIDPTVAAQPVRNSVLAQIDVFFFPITGIRFAAPPAAPPAAAVPAAASPPTAPD